MAWEEPGIGRYLAFLAGQGTVFILLVLLIESRKIESIWYRVRPPPPPADDVHSGLTQPEDSDVAQERKRINNSSVPILQETDTLILQNLSKYYGNFLATDHLCLGVPKGETFGLLGVNGAGKTTTFKMMTGELIVSEGNAFLGGYDVRRNIKKVNKTRKMCISWLCSIAVKTTVPFHVTGLRAMCDSVLDKLTLLCHAISSSVC